MDTIDEAAASHGGDPPNSARTSATVESTGHGLNRYEQDKASNQEWAPEADLYTDAVITCLRLPQVLRHTGVSRIVAQTIPIAVMVACAATQMLVVHSVYAHISKDMIHAKWNLVDALVEKFVGLGLTMPKGQYQALCGTYVQNPILNGPMGKVVMPDGTTYSSDGEHPMWYSAKMPSDTWDPTQIGSAPSLLDEARFVMEERFLDPSTPVVIGYAHLFVIFVALWYMTLLVEYRNIISFACMLIFTKTGNPEEDRYTLKLNKAGKFDVVHMTVLSKCVGATVVLLRLVIVTALLYTGSLFLLYTTAKVELIMHSMALVFVLELDHIVYIAIVSGLKQKFINDVNPIPYTLPSSFLTKGLRKLEILLPVLAIAFCFLASVTLRAHQRSLFYEFYNDAASLCLFAGPTPEARTDIVAPVPGMCETLLTMVCAPSVKGVGVVNGPCVVTDQGVFVEWQATYKRYVNDELFQGMQSGKSYTDWGSAQDGLFDDHAWTGDLLRKICVQLWQSTHPVDYRLVDTPGVGEMNWGAPFFCSKDLLFPAIFGKTRPIKGVGEGTEGSIVFHMEDLQSDRAARAINACKPQTAILTPPRLGPLVRKDKGESPLLQTSKHLSEQKSHTSRIKRLQRRQSLRKHYVKHS